MTDRGTVAWDLFISHASEDKESFVRPLALALRGLGIYVWYDEFELRPGDSVIASIDRGIANSSFGLLILSPQFLDKPFPEYERRGITSRDVHDETRLLPVWYGVTRDQVARFSPSLADRVAIRVDSSTPVKAIALQVLKRVRPDLFDSLLRLAAFRQKMQQAESAVVPISDLKQGPSQHERLSPSLIAQIQLIHAIVSPYYRRTLEERIDDFKRDIRPQNELIYWQCMCTVLIEHMSTYSDCLEEVFTVLLASTLGSLSDDVFQRLKRLTRQDAEALHIRYLQVLGQSQVST